MKRRKFARRAVRRFMPGEEVEDAIRAAQKLGRRGLGVVLTELGENVTTAVEAGYRSVVAHVPGTASTWIAIGPSGSDVSTDGSDRSPVRSLYWRWMPITPDSLPKFAILRMSASPTMAGV